MHVFLLETLAVWELINFNKYSELLFKVMYDCYLQAKMLEELDNEFGISGLVEAEFGTKKVSVSV